MAATKTTKKTTKATKATKTTTSLVSPADIEQMKSQQHPPPTPPWHSPCGSICSCRYAATICLAHFERPCGASFMSSICHRPRATRQHAIFTRGVLSKANHLQYSSPRAKSIRKL